MRIENFKTSKLGATHLLTIKKRTGFSEYHPICRYAFCYSLGDLTPPREQEFDSQGVFLEWSTFGQEFSELLYGFLLTRCKHDGVSLHADSIRHEFLKHLHRGLGAFASKSSNILDEGIMGLPSITNSLTNR